MLSNLGNKIKTIRIQKGIGLNKLANRLGVSPAYLSNLENGKSETIQLSFLKKLQEELNLSLCSFCDKELIKKEYDPLEYRAQRVSQLLSQIASQNPNAAEYLISVIEKGAELFSKPNPSQEIYKN